MCVCWGEIEGRIREREKDSPVSIILLLLIYLARSPQFFLLFFSLYLPTLSTLIIVGSLYYRAVCRGGGLCFPLPFLFSSVTTSRRGCMDFFCFLYHYYGN